MFRLSSVILEGIETETDGMEIRKAESMEQNLYDSVAAYIIENQNRFYRLAYSYVGDREAALDVVQNAILKGLEKCDTLRNQDAVKTWFYRIVVNEALQILRARKREELSADREVFEQAYTEPAYDREREVYEAVRNLPDPGRTVVILHYYEDLTLKQIAEITDVNLNTVKYRLYSSLVRRTKSVKVDALGARRMDQAFSTASWFVVCWFG